MVFSNSLQHRHLLAFTLFMCGLLCASLGFAQIQGEVLWRVENGAFSEQAPLYDGQPSPFPIKMPPPPPNPDELARQARAAQPQLTPEQLLAQQRAQKAASLMSRVRDTLKEDQAFKPDLSGIIIEAIVSGEAGFMALVKGKWFFEGDYIQTPVITAQELLGLMASLENLDKKLASIVRSEVEARLAGVGPQQVLVREIKNTGISLRLPNGRGRVISFASRGW